MHMQHLERLGLARAQVLRPAYEAKLAEGIAEDTSFDQFAARVLGLDTPTALLGQAPQRLPPLLFSPNETPAEDFVVYLEKLAASHSAATHPYLRRLASGQLPNPRMALLDFARQYLDYDERFKGMVEHVMGLMSLPESRLVLGAAVCSPWQASAALAHFLPAAIEHSRLVHGLAASVAVVGTPCTT
jgi:hypothetical protein